VDVGEAAAGQPHHHTLDAAVPDDDVGADAQHGDRDLRRQRGEERAQVVRVGRQEEHIRRSADPKPGERRQRRVDQQLAADGGEMIAPGHDTPDGAIA